MACRARTEPAATHIRSRFGQNTGVDERVMVQGGLLAPPGDWLSEAPHLVRAVLDDRVRIREVPRHKGVIAAVRAIDKAPLQRRRKLWWTIRRGLGLYDPDVLRDEAIRVGLLATVHDRPVIAQPELEEAAQLLLFAAARDEKSSSD